MTFRPLRFALLADGPSDRALIPIIRWTIGSLSRVPLAEPGFEARTPSQPLEGEIGRVAALHLVDILFVHRDAETETLSQRRSEIPRASAATVRVVPVRMTESWLLISEAAIRIASDNPRGRVPLALPRTSNLEKIADPKTRLQEFIVSASEATGRKRKRLIAELPSRVQRVAEQIQDFSPLRQLPAFQAFEDDCREALSLVRPGT